MQSSIETNTPGGMAGQIVDLGPKDIITRINTSNAVIPFGRFVTKGAVQDSAVLPDASGEVTGLVGLGVTVRTLANKDADGYADEAAMSVMKKGRIWVQVENAVVAESQAYARFSAGESAGNLGAFRSNAASQNEIQTVEFTGTPANSTWTLTLGAETTAAMAYNANAGAIKAALEALTGIIEVTVTGSYAAGLAIEFTGDDALKAFALMTVNVTALAGVTAAAVAETQAGSGAANEIQTVTFTGTPVASTWTLTLDTEETSALAYNANAATIKAALEALTAITTVTITGSYAAGFTIEFTGADAATVFDAMTVDVSALSGVTAAAVTVEQQGCPIEAAAVPRAKFVTDAAGGELALLDLSMT